MKVKELKKVLENVPDDYDVTAGGFVNMEMIEDDEEDENLKIVWSGLDVAVVDDDYKQVNIHFAY